MDKHHRADSIKPLIAGGHITEFSQIFIYVPKTAVAEHLGIPFGRFERFLKNVKEMKFKEMYSLCYYFEIDSKTMFDLIETQHSNSVKKVTRKK